MSMSSISERQNMNLQPLNEYFNLCDKIKIIVDNAGTK